jgi:hypothetical protein
MVDKKSEKPSIFTDDHNQGEHDLRAPTPQPDPAAARMQALVEQWQGTLKGVHGFPRRPEDHRVVFLHCYLLMTNNMLAAIQRQEFHDSAWVDKLLHIFAGYYFTALDAYELDPSTASPVWQLAFEAARHPGTLALQHLLLGVNAHINYDLILALVDILAPEWDGLTEDQRLRRYQDHCRVNQVIGNTVDAVEQEVLDPEMPIIRIVDTLMGHLDEAMISDLLGHWREIVWHHVTRLLEIQEPDERARLVKHYEKEVLEIGEIIQLRGFHPQR